jgi:hypothetical protein
MSFFRWDAVEQQRGFGSLDGSFVGEGTWGVVVEGSDKVKMLGNDEVGAVFAAQGISRKNMGIVYYVVHVPGTIDPATEEREMLPRYRIKTVKRGREGRAEDTRIVTHFTDGKLKLALHRLRKEGHVIDHRDPDNLKWKLSRWDITIEDYKKVLDKARLAKGTERMRQEAPPQGAEYTMRDVPRGQKQKRLRQGRPAPVKGATGEAREVPEVEMERIEAQRRAELQRQQEADAAAVETQRQQAVEAKALAIQRLRDGIKSLKDRKEYAEQQVLKGIAAPHWTTQREAIIERLAAAEAELRRALGQSIEEWLEEQG